MLTKGTDLGKDLLALVEREITADGGELMCIVNDVYGMILSDQHLHKTRERIENGEQEC